MEIFNEIFCFLFNQYTLFAIVLLLLLYRLGKRDSRVDYELGKFGSPPSIPVLGSCLYLNCPHREWLPIFDSWFKTYGKSHAFWIGNFLGYLMTADPNVVEAVTSNMTHLEKGKWEYSLFLPWLGTGLLTAPGVKWQSRRKLLTPSFHFTILEDFLPIFNEQADVFLNCLKADGHENGDIFNMYPYISRCTLDIICETAMGKKMNMQTSSVNKDYLEAVDGMCKIITIKNTLPWLRIPYFYDLTSYSRQEKRYLHLLKSFTREVIKARRQQRALPQEMEQVSPSPMKRKDSFEMYGKERKAFLDLMLDVAEEGQQLSDAGIQEEVDTFCFEGHDTTAVGLGWIILMLAIHPECQARVHEELDSIFADDFGRDVTITDLSSMNYLDCCIKESLRLFPSVPLIMRQIYQDIPLDGGKIIPRGCTALINIFSLHRDPEYFPDPETYSPDRFLMDSSGSGRRHPFSYIPFSAGPRNCIGQKFANLELKIIVAKVFRAYRIETNEQIATLRPMCTVVTRCENGVHVKLHKR